MANAAIKRWLVLLLASGMLLLYGCGTQTTEQTEQSEQTQQTQQDTKQAAEPTAAQPEQTETLPLDGVTICLDAGHGVTSETAQERVSPLSDETKAAYVSGASGASQTEEELVLDVAQRTQASLEALGARVVMTRSVHDIALSNIERAQIANEAAADLCIRLHADGVEDTSARGMSMQIPSGDLLGTPSIVQPSRQAAEIILACVTQATGARSRGLVERSDLTGFNWSAVPCVLLEMGFLSNAEEDALLAQDSYRQTIAQAIAQGVCQWNE